MYVVLYRHNRPNSSMQFIAGPLKDVDMTRAYAESQAKTHPEGSYFVAKVEEKLTGEVIVNKEKVE